MAEIDSKILSTMFANARKQPQNFALLVGKKDMVLEVHRTKSADAMRRVAKAGGGGPKGAWGTMKLAGKKLIVTCEETPYGTFTKDAKKFFAGLGQNVQVIVELNVSDPVVEDPLASAKRTQAAGDSIADDEPEGEDEVAETDYGKIIKTARKAPLNFAWLLSKEAPVLRAHRRKPVGALVKSAKADGGTQRGGWGQFKVSGKVIVLTCLEDPPEMFVRAARVQLKSAGFKFQIEVHGPSGVVVSQNEEDSAPGIDGTGEVAVAAAGDAAPENAVTDAPVQTVDRLMEEYRVVFASLKPLLVGGDPASIRALKSELKEFSHTLVAKDTVTAATLLDQLRRHLAPSSTVRATILPDLMSLEQNLDALLAEMENVLA